MGAAAFRKVTAPEATPSGRFPLSRKVRPLSRGSAIVAREYEF
jgi:hypothetical protein